MSTIDIFICLLWLSVLTLLLLVSLIPKKRKRFTADDIFQKDMYKGLDVFLNTPRTKHKEGFVKIPDLEVDSLKPNSFEVINFSIKELN